MRGCVLRAHAPGYMLAALRGSNPKADALMAHIAECAIYAPPTERAQGDCAAARALSRHFAFRVQANRRFGPESGYLNL